MGVTVEELNGWTPATVTLDAAGEVVSVTVTQSRFTPAAVETLLASRRLEHGYNEHGIPYVEAMDPENQFKFKAVGPRTDWAVEAVNRAQSMYREANKDVDMSALRWGVEKL